MSISKDNEETGEPQQPEVITLDLRDVMREIEVSGVLPDGFVMVYLKH